MLETVDADEIASDTQCSAPAEHGEVEATLSSEITVLWSAHQDGKAVAKRTRAELKAIRHSLGERLHAMKALLARSGRSGQWSAFLRESRIPRADDSDRPGQRGGTGQR
jgi:hypothetical protein